MRAAALGMAVLVAVLPCAQSAWAGGIWLYEMATPDQGTAVAGRAALGLDASTAWANPAGMTRLDQSQLLLGAGPVVIQSEFNTRAGTTTSGGGTNLTTALPDGSAYYVQNVTPDFKLGLALTTQPGLAADYGDTWAGRYFLDKAALFGVAISPVAAYRIAPWLSVGAGPSFGHSQLSQDSLINNVADRLPDGTLKVRGSGWGVGGVVGVMIEPTAATRFGVQYVTPMSITYNNIIESVQGLGPGLKTIFLSVGGLIGIPAGSQVDLTLTMPQQVMASVYHQFNDKLALMGNFGWQNWSAFGEPSVVVRGDPSNLRFTADQGYTDTFHTAIGAHYRLTDSWRLMAGFAYDSSAVPSSKRTVAFPVDEQFRWGFGVQWAVTQAISLGAVYTGINGGSAPVNQSRPLAGTLVGDYSPNLIHAIGFYLSWRFQ